MKKYPFLAAGFAVFSLVSLPVLASEQDNYRQQDPNQVCAHVVGAAKSQEPVRLTTQLAGPENQEQASGLSKNNLRREWQDKIKQNAGRKKAKKHSSSRRVSVNPTFLEKVKKLASFLKAEQHEVPEDADDAFFALPPRDDSTPGQENDESSHKLNALEVSRKLSELETETTDTQKLIDESLTDDFHSLLGVIGSNNRTIGEQAPISSEELSTMAAQAATDLNRLHCYMQNEKIQMDSAPVNNASITLLEADTQKRANDIARYKALIEAENASLELASAEEVTVPSNPKSNALPNASLYQQYAKPWATSACVVALLPVAYFAEPHVRQAFADAVGPQAATLYPAASYLAGRAWDFGLQWALATDIRRIFLARMKSSVTDPYVPLPRATLAVGRLAFLGHIGSAAIEGAAHYLKNRCFTYSMLNLAPSLGTAFIDNCAPLGPQINMTLSYAFDVFSKIMKAAVWGGVGVDVLNAGWHYYTHTKQKKA